MMDKKQVLPQDIMLLICQELGARRDFATLCRCSFLSRRIASIAVEQLYSILEVMDPFIDDKLQAARLWRSLILSSLGVTLFPYCAYLRVLSLGSLIECLTDIRTDVHIRDFFFGGPMQEFISPETKPFNNNAIASRCGDSITNYIKALADSSGIATALTHLESNISALSRDTLSTWISRLGTLTSLQLEDGSVLGPEAGSAIAQYCPRFAELICFHYTSETAAQDMAGFFLALRPNSLRRFEVHSVNNFNLDTFAALSCHAQSLRVLNLRSLRPVADEGLYPLFQCTALESLLIERDENEFGLHASSEPQGLAQWIGSCTALRELSLIHVREAFDILKQVLQAPEIHLDQLLIQDFRSTSDADEKTVWNALGQQDRLRMLTIASQDSFPDGLVLSWRPELTNSICRLSNLTTLNLMQAYVSSAEIQRFAACLPGLEELSFGGDLVEVSVLEHLSKLRKLVLLSINAVTAFTFEHLRKFAQQLDPVTNSGIRIDLLNNWYEVKLTEQEEGWLNEYFANELNGRISISYPNEHESDFSDSE